MGIKPLDLQVSINSVIETSRDQGLRQATLAQEQRTVDGHMIDDARHRSRIVNETPKSDSMEKLEDTEKHFGNKTEAELEQEFSGEDQKEKKARQDEKSPETDKGKEKSEEHKIDTLA